MPENEENVDLKPTNAAVENLMEAQSDLSLVDQNLVEEAPEQKELTEEEQHEIYIKMLKESKIKFRPLSHPIKTVEITTTTNKIGRTVKVKNKKIMTNVTVNQFGADYRKKRQMKNKMAKQSRRANR